MSIENPIIEITLIILFLLIYSSVIGAIIRAYYFGNRKFRSFQKIVIFIAELPSKIFFYLKQSPISSFFVKPIVLLKHVNKERFTKHKSSSREGLLILPRYDHSENRSLVEIIDLNNFKIIHTYKHDIQNMNKKVKNKKYFPGLNTMTGAKTFLYWDPVILDDGSLICDGNNGPEFKIDFRSNLKWINDEMIFHHSKNLDHENNCWICARFFNKSKILNDYLLKEVNDDAIVKINTDGEILFKKSVIEILFENKIWDQNHITELKKNHEPVHLNCIEPVFNDTKYWKQGDVFINLKHKSQIVLYRPSTNKVINLIKGPFSMQHDIKVISDNKISIFNNNNFIYDNKYSEVLIYDFESEQFSKIFSKELQKENFKTNLSGKSQILKDNSLFVVEQRHGRIILLDNKGQKEWEYINKSKNGDVGYVSGCRIIENKSFIKKFKSLIN